jgi:hypothetical protein
MADFHSSNVWTGITAAARANGGASEVAVAYFSTEGPRLLPLRAGSILVVDASLETVASGGTSPAALRQMLTRGARIFSAQNLHAKVFVFGGTAFIGSSNASMKSSRFLIEAAVEISDPPVVDAARAFVRSLMVTELDDAALQALQVHYRPPPRIKFPPRQAPFTTLVMQLTKEQGGKRATQVQPPIDAWRCYFGIDPAAPTLPRLRLTYKGSAAVGPAPGTISRHHHNLTVEIPGAELPRPAILELRKTGRNAYDYDVHRFGADFDRLSRLLSTRSNPLWTRGRRWLII